MTFRHRATAMPATHAAREAICHFGRARLLRLHAGSALSASRSPRYDSEASPAYAALGVSNARQLRHVIRDGERGRQSGRLDAEQVDQPAHAMDLRSLDHEIL